MHGRRIVLALVATTAVIAGAGACETDATGVEDCRDIERARCRAARHCDDLGIKTDADVRQCERYMRDHCLHGFETDEDPRTVDLNACVDAIEQAAECARKGDDAPCARLRARGSDATACEMIQAPEELADCGFLISEPPRNNDDAGRDPDPVEDAGSDAGD